MDESIKFPIVVRWYDSSSHGKISWFFRGIREDGSFYGDVKNIKLHNNIEGKLEEQDCVAVVNILYRLTHPSDAIVPLTLVNGWKGLLALGTIQNPEVIIYYCDGDELRNYDCKLFLDIISLLRKYVPIGFRYP
jgi:hypothetical protein